MADDMAVSYYRHRHKKHVSKRYEYIARDTSEDNYNACYIHKHNRNTHRKQVLKTLYYDSSFYARDESSSDFENISSVINENKYEKQRKRKLKHQRTKQSLEKFMVAPNILTTKEYLNILSKMCSTPDVQISDDHRRLKAKRRGSDVYLNTSTPFKTKFIVNAVSLYPEMIPQECRPLLNNPFMQAQMRVYRCQLSTKQETCCCSCNSDAMFEVMKSLYDCYKKKDCNNCNCVLCGHLPLEERVRGEARKSAVAKGVETARSRQKTKETMKKAEEAGLATPLTGKSREQKEKIVRDLAKLGLPLPEAKTSSEKKIIDKVRKELGLPPEPKTMADRKKHEKAANLGLMQPLEGMTTPEKENQLQQWHDMGIELPEGRTQSEKDLIAKIKAGPKKPSVKSRKTQADLEKERPSEKLRKARTAGLLTPLEGKTPEQKEKILRGLVQAGIPLPEAKTESEKKITDKVRTDLGLPPEPRTAAEKQKYAKAQAAGLITPLEGKSEPQKEKILRELAERGVPLPEGRTSSEKALIKKIQDEVKPVKMRKVEDAKRRPGVPSLPPAERKKIDAKTAKNLKEGTGPVDECICGQLTPESERISVSKLSAVQKEKVLRSLAQSGHPLPEGKTPSEKALIKEIEAEERRVPSARLRKAKDEGFLTPLEGKTPEQKEKILRGLVKHGIPLPEGKTASDKKLIDKVRKDVGLPPAPKTAAEKEKYAKAQAAGLITPLEGKSKPQKEEILRGLAKRGVPLPEGRTSSEKALIKKIQDEERRVPSAKLRKAKEESFLTPLEGKTPEQKEKILRGLVQAGIPLPEAKTASEKKVTDKVRKDLGLPPEPRTAAEKETYAQAQAEGLITPLEGKTKPQKEEILRGLAKRGVPLPEGRTSSEKALIKKIQDEERRVPSAKLRKAKEEGFLTPLQGKTPEQKENILRGLVQAGIPLPEAKTASEKKITDNVRKDFGLPPEPKTAAEKETYAQAQAEGLITPLEGKSGPQKEKILRELAKRGVPLPEGRTSSEKALIKKIQDEVKPVKTRKVEEAKRRPEGPPALPPAERKKLDEKTAKNLKEGTGPVDECICPQLTPESERKSVSKLSAAQKEKVLRSLAQIQAEQRRVPSARLRKAKDEGFLTPLEGKTPEQKERILRGLVKHGIPLPEGKTASDKKLIDKVRKDVGLPPAPKTAAEKEKYAKAQAAGLITPLEGKSEPQKEKILRELAMSGVPLPEGRTSSEKALIKKIEAEIRPVSSEVRVPSEKLRRAHAAGLLTPLSGKTPAEKERIIRDLALNGLPLPEGKTASEKKLIDKVRKDLGLPPEPKTSSEKTNYMKAQAAGLITPLEGKSDAQKEKILKALAERGVPLPEGRTSSEKALIKKIGETARGYEKARAQGLMTPLEGKSSAQKEKILRGRVEAGLPLPEGKTPSEKALIRKIKAETGYVSPTPLHGKSLSEKERILKGRAESGLPMPKGRTPSEKKLIKKVTAEMKQPKGRPVLPPAERKKLDEKTEKNLKEGKGPVDECICGLLTPESERETVPSKKLQESRPAGIITPLEGKTPEQKEKILKSLADAGLPLPESKTASDRAVAQKVRTELGLPPEPRRASMKEKMSKAHAAGIITPLEGKTPSQKEKILKSLTQAGIPLPEGRTASEKALIKKVVSEAPSRARSRKLREAKAAGLLTPLEGKTPEQKEKILRGLVQAGIPLPQAKTESERKITDKVRKDLGLPPEPRTAAEKEAYAQAQAAGLITPLEGKSEPQKEKILRGLAERGVPLPEGRTSSEKALIKKIQDEVKPVKMRKTVEAKRRPGVPSLPPAERKKLDEKTAKNLKEGKGPVDDCICGLLTPESERETVPSRKLQESRPAGIITPLEGKTPEQKEKILKSLADAGLPLPESKTASDRAVAQKVRTELGLPPEPRRASMKEKMSKAHAAGIITPLEGKTPSQKEKILKSLTQAGIPLPEGRTASEKELIKKVTSKAPSRARSRKLREAKAAGLLTPLEGKTPEQKEKILRGLVQAGIPLPEAKTASDKKITDKVRKDFGLPPEPRTAAEKETYAQAQAEGLITPLEGKSESQKEKILRELAKRGVPLPEGRTSSEKALIKKIQDEVKPVKMRKVEEAKRRPEGPPALPPAERKKLDEKTAKNLKEGTGPVDECICPQLTPESERVSREPLEAAQREKVLRSMATAGVPLPEGRTASEKALIKKVQTEKEAVGSKKKYKTSKIGTTTSKKIPKGMVTRSVAGIKEEVEEIIKTTTCEKGCGCDKKKIRFKHSYVKIRVTSPDISSFCPCPDECIPGVKGGVFTDNEGIKVTVGRATGIPLLTSQHNFRTFVHNNSCQGFARESKNKLPCSQSFISLEIASLSTSMDGLGSKSTVCFYYSDSNVSITDIERHLRGNVHKRKSENSSYRRRRRTPSQLYRSRIEIHRTGSPCEYQSSTPSQIASNNSYTMDKFSDSSSGSYYIIETEFTDSDYSRGTISGIFSLDNNLEADSIFTHASENEHEKHTDSSPGCSLGPSNMVPVYTVLSTHKKKDTNKAFDVKSDTSCHRRYKKQQEKMSIKPTGINFPNQDIVSILKSPVFSKSLSSLSSIFVLVPTPINEENTSESLSSTICLKTSQHFTGPQPPFSSKKRNSGLRITNKGRRFYMEGIPKDDIGGHGTELFSTEEPLEKMEDSCQTSKIQLKIQSSCRAVFMDTTEDRPCCCNPDIPTESVNEAISEILVNPTISREGGAQSLIRLNEDRYLSVVSNQTPSFQTTGACKPAPPCCCLPKDNVPIQRERPVKPEYYLQVGERRKGNVPSCEESTCHHEESGLAHRQHPRRPEYLQINKVDKEVEVTSCLGSTCHPEDSNVTRRETPTRLEYLQIDSASKGCIVPSSGSNTCHFEDSRGTRRERPRRPWYFQIGRLGKVCKVAPDKENQDDNAVTHRQASAKLESSQTRGYHPKNNVPTHRELSGRLECLPNSQLDDVCRPCRCCSKDNPATNREPHPRPEYLHGNQKGEGYISCQDGNQKKGYKVSPCEANVYFPQENIIHHTEYPIGPEYTEINPRGNNDPSNKTNACDPEDNHLEYPTQNNQRGYRVPPNKTNACFPESNIDNHREYLTSAKYSQVNDKVAVCRSKHSTVNYVESRMCPEYLQTSPTKKDCKIPPCRRQSGCHFGDRSVDRSESPIGPELLQTSQKGIGPPPPCKERAKKGKPARIMVKCNPHNAPAAGCLGLQQNVEKIKATLQQLQKQMKSTAVGSSTALTSKRMDTPQSSTADIIQKLPRTPSGTVFCSDKELLNKLMSTCPCPAKGIQAEPRVADGGQPGSVKQVDAEVETDKKGLRGYKSKKGKKNKNHTCECPPPEPILLEDFDWSSLEETQGRAEKAKRKMKSDLTQTTSGFKMKQKKRPPPPPPVDDEMSFEDALAYFEAHPEDTPPPLRVTYGAGATGVAGATGSANTAGTAGQAQRQSTGEGNKNRGTCECPGEGSIMSKLKWKKKKDDCVCPEPLPPPPLPGDGIPGAGGISSEQEEPFFGLKFHLGGKGSGTPGLAGICCFDLIEASYDSLPRMDSDHSSISILI